MLRGVGLAVRPTPLFNLRDHASLNAKGSYTIKGVPTDCIEQRNTDDREHATDHRPLDGLEAALVQCDCFWLRYRQVAKWVTNRPVIHPFR